MVAADLLEVVDLENENPSGWSAELLTGELEVTGAIQLVAEGHGSDAGQLVGWCACRVIPPEAELLKIAVNHSDRRSGFGHLLLEGLLTELTDRKVRSLFLEVRAQNLAAVSFYKKHGFVHVGARRNYYRDPTDSALLFRLDLL